MCRISPFVPRLAGSQHACSAPRGPRNSLTHLRELTSKLGCISDRLEGHAREPASPRPQTVWNPGQGSGFGRESCKRVAWQAPPADWAVARPSPAAAFAASDVAGAACAERSRMQGVAAQDIIHHDQHSQQDPGAHLRPGSPPARLTAYARELERHGPSLAEQEVGAALHPDPNALHGHPGVDCHALPTGHAHR